MATMPKANVLLVDDEPHFRLSLRIILNALGYAVHAVENGFSALAEIRSEVPDILISDLFMPGMSGFELLSTVRESYPSIRTIAMCALFSDDQIPAGIAADAFHRKGSSLDSLLSTVDMMTRSGQADSFAAHAPKQAPKNARDGYERELRPQPLYPRLRALAM